MRTRHVPVAVARVEGREDWLARNLSSRQDRRYAGADRPFPHDAPALTRDQRLISDLDPSNIGNRVERSIERDPEIPTRYFRAGRNCLGDECRRDQGCGEAHNSGDPVDIHSSTFGNQMESSLNSRLDCEPYLENPVVQKKSRCPKQRP